MKKYRPVNCYPLLGTRLVIKGKSKTLMIKVRMDGPQAKRWMTWQRWWWEQNRGPVPKGNRVFFLDGNPENRSPENICCGTPGDIFVISDENDPTMFGRMRAAASAATAEMNKRRGEINRKKTWLPSQWYAVFHDRKQILNIPRRSRSGIIRIFGGTLSKNGRLPKEELPFEPTRGRDIGPETHSGYRRINKVTLHAKRAIEAMALGDWPVIAPNPTGLCQCGCGGTTSKATAHYPDVSLGQFRRFIVGHYADQKHATGIAGKRLRESALRISIKIIDSLETFRSDELLGPVFEEALDALRQTRRVKRAVEAARLAAKAYFTGQKNYGRVSIDYLREKGIEIEDKS